jgi:hypothetical protein
MQFVGACGFDPRWGFEIQKVSLSSPQSMVKFSHGQGGREWGTIMKYLIGAVSLGAGLAVAAAVLAEPYVDYTPQKGVTEVQTVKVDPNHIDDYLTGLRTGWVPGEELAKKHGVIDFYAVSVKLNSGAGPNVVLIQHYPSMSMLEPDRARDTAMMREGRAMVSKEQQERMTTGYDKYRTFVSDDFYSGVDFVK